MDGSNYRFDYNIGFDSTKKKTNMLLVILGYYNNKIYVKTAYPDTIETKSKHALYIITTK